jgi:hypothetical protein
MKKILDFIIIFLLIFLIISLFNKQDNKIAETQVSNVIIKTLEKSYTVPSGIKLEVENKTTKDLEIDVCKDLQVKYIQTDTIIQFDEKFCKDNIITIKSGLKSEIDYSSVYKDFKEK